MPSSRAGARSATACCLVHARLSGSWRPSSVRHAQQPLSWGGERARPLTSAATHQHWHGWQAQHQQQQQGIMTTLTIASISRTAHAKRAARSVLKRVHREVQFSRPKLHLLHSVCSVCAFYSLTLSHSPARCEQTNDQMRFPLSLCVREGVEGCSSVLEGCGE